MTDELSVLQALRLKGRPSFDHLVGSLQADPGLVQQRIDAAVAAEHCAAAGKGYKITPAGRERLAELTAAERATLDSQALTSLYEDFHHFNTDLKSLITSWQMKEPEVPNDHSDAGYDQQIVERLVALHQSFEPWLDRLTAVCPRMAPYPGRFRGALAAVQSGDHSMIAKPLADSYHTVWFELHEELIGLMGLDRESEASAGRAL